MGRKRLKTVYREDRGQRHQTFLKRKGGLFKKAAELSILCRCEIFIRLLSENGELFVQNFNGDANATHQPPTCKTGSYFDALALHASFSTQGNPFKDQENISSNPFHDMENTIENISSEMATYFNNLLCEQENIRSEMSRIENLSTPEIEGPPSISYQQMENSFNTDTITSEMVNYFSNLLTDQEEISSDMNQTENLSSPEGPSSSSIPFHQTENPFPTLSQQILIHSPIQENSFPEISEFSNHELEMREDQKSDTCTGDAHISFQTDLLSESSFLSTADIELWFQE